MRVSAILTFFTFSLIAQEYNFRPVDDIINLSRGQKISSQTYDQFDSTTIAESLVQRLRNNRERVISKNKYNYLKDSEIQIAFDDKNLKSIKNGCFKNQHQTNSSNGILNNSRRKNLENNMIGLDLNDQEIEDQEKLNWVRPIYAFLTLTQKTSKKYRSYRMSPQYGNIFGILKDSVKRRATWTPGDSLDITAGRNNTRSFYFQSSKMVKNTSQSYFEVQIWGKTCFKDVSYFIVNCPFTKSVPPEKIKALKATGIPVYSCLEKRNSKRSSNVYAIKKGNLI